MSRQKLVETILVDRSNMKKLPIQESQKVLTEEGNKVTCSAAYTFPVSRPDQKNLNERVYTSKLWEKVIREGQGVGSFGLTDHPSDDGSIRDTACVWKNVRFNEDKSLVLADAYLFGQWGTHIQEALEVGGRIGLSTVGYGDFKEDNCTIEEDTYELDRVADFVLNPSYEVFGTIEDKKEEAILSNNSATIKESDTGMEPETIEEKVESMQTNTANKIEEKNFRISVKNLIEKARSNEDLDSRQEAFTEILEYFDDVDFADDLKEDVKNELQVIDVKVRELAEKGKKTDELEESAKTLNEKIETLEAEKSDLESKVAKLSEEYDRAVTLLDSLKAFSKKVKEMYETQRAKSNGMITAKEYNELLSYTEGVEEELKSFKTKYATLREKIKANKVKRENADEEKDRRKKVREDYRLLRKNRVEAEKADDEDEEDDDEDEEVDESVVVNTEDVNPDVLLYYQDLEESNPSVVKIRKYILSCRTLIEAQREFFRLQSLLDEDYSVDRREIQREDDGLVLRTAHDVVVERPFHQGWV